MLEKVELIVFCLHIEVFAVDIYRACGAGAKGRVGQYYIGHHIGLELKRVAALDGAAVGSDPVEIEIH